MPGIRKAEKERLASLRGKASSVGESLDFGPLIERKEEWVAIDNKNGKLVKTFKSEKEAKAFMNALGSEARYVKAAKDHGLNNPRTFKSKNKLNNAIKGFEKATGLKWPFK